MSQRASSDMENVLKDRETFNKGLTGILDLPELEEEMPSAEPWSGNHTNGRGAR
jgi:hypothetical protein